MGTFDGPGKRGTGGTDHGRQRLSTRAAIPLLPIGRAPPPIQDLNPVFDIAGEPHVLLAQDIGSVPVRDPTRPVATLRAERDAITRALDILLIGF
jgi:toxin CcdB